MEQRPGKDWLRRPFGGSTGPTVAALRTVLYYAVTATVWILFSDRLIRAFTVNPDMLTELANIKGVLFVIVTSALLFFQIRSDLAHLQESERRFRRVVDVSPVPMLTTDVDGNVTFVNRAFVRLLGYTTKDIPTVDAWWASAYPDPEYRIQVREAWEREVARSRAAGEPVDPQEARILCKDGVERTMLVSLGALAPESPDEVVVFYDITQRTQAEAAVLAANERLEAVLRSVTGLIGKVVETRDPYTLGHEQGVARISRLIAEEMGLPADMTEGIEVAALVHDVGKLGVPAEILTKPGKLNDLEFKLIKGHAEQGYEILKEIDFDWPVAETVRMHHERMDGSGYPSGLRGDEIPMAARIIMVADVIEAMGAHRPYRSALGLDAAMREISTHPDKYDASVIAACERLHEAGRITV